MASSDLQLSKTHIKHKRNRSQLPHQENGNLHHHPQEESPSPKKSKPNPTWSNLDLILSLKNNNLNDQRKIELAIDFVNSNENRPPQPVSISRLASFLSDWIQPLLIRDKISLDYRCWVILTFSLKNSTGSVSLYLLKSITQVLKHSDDGSPEGKRLLENSLECFELILSSNSRAFRNASMDLWKPCVVEVSSVVRNISMDDGCGHSRLSVLLLEHFVNFLRFHKDPTNIFSKFVDGLVEPLLELLVLLQIRSKDQRLLKLVEDVLANGLFHPSHIGGFFSLKQNNWAPKGHREFFKKLGNIIKEKKAMALWGFGSLFRLFVTSAKAHKGAYLSSKGNQALVKINKTTDEQQETSKPLFEVFVQFMHPLFLECKRYSGKELSEFGEDLNDWLLEARGMIKSMNETLMSFIQEKVYVRTEDTSEGAHYKFLEEVYDAIFSLSGKIYQLWLSTLHMVDDREKKMLHLVAREIVAAIGYFVEIEYRVVDNDLVKLWHMMFSFLAAHISMEEEQPSSSLTSQVLNLGCKLLNIYSELRQVNNPLFALCKAVRVLTISGDADLEDYSMFVSSPSLSSHIYINSVEYLLCSQEFQVTMSAAVKSIPEGQAGGFIQHLGTDITDSLLWIRSTFSRSDGKDSSEMSYLDMQSELLGRFLSEVYTTVLDSLTVTATNCIPIGNSVKNLIGTIGQHLINLVNSQSDGIDEFIFPITGRKLCDHEISESDCGITWFIVFFFRIYISCRSLYRQVISLMPPDSSTKAAKSMGIFFSVARECDWKEEPEIMDEGYFSWIVKPSISLLSVIRFSEDLLPSNSSGFPSLCYVVQIMALQRLNDLNRLIRAFEFVQGSEMHKPIKQWKNIKRLLKVYRAESAKLMNYMTGYWKLLDCKELYRYVRNNEDDAWDLVVCSLNASSLRIAIWRLLCQNFDVWCVHADKKHIEKFLSCLFFYSVQSAKPNEPFARKITMHHISTEFSTNIVSYEQPILHRYFAPRFCRVVKKSLSPILSHASASNTDLRSEPVWSEFLEMFGKGLSVGIDGRPNVQYLGVNEKRSSSFNLELRTCESLLSLLCKIPKVYVDAKSFQVYASYVLNIEKLAVSNLLSNQCDSFIYNPYSLLKLFLSCRRAMKYLLIASFEDSSGVTESSPISSVLGSSESILWLLKSLSEIVGLSHSLYEEKYSNQVHDANFSLIEHTSFVFFAISEKQLNATKIFLTNDEKFHKENPVDTLEVLGERLLDAFEGSLHAFKLEGHSKVMIFSRLSAEVSCLQGFLWGLISVLDSQNEGGSTVNLQFSQFVAGCLSKFSKYVSAFENVVKLCFNMLVMDDKSENLHNLQNLLDALTDCDYHDNGGNLLGCDYNQSSNNKKQKLPPFDAISVANGFNAVHRTDLFKRSFLQSLLKGEAPQIAFTLRQLFTASAAILKLNKLLLSRSPRSDIHYSKLAAISIGVLLGISELFMREMAEMVGRQDPFSFVLLDGVLTFLEVASDFKLSEDVYTRLIDTNLRAIGKCISLQGKSATLSSHKTLSNTKMLQSQSSGNGFEFVDHVRFSLNAFISRLRMSFIKYIKGSNSFYLEMALQSLERALVGVQQGCNMVSGINTGNVDGGVVFPFVAAGIDCFDLVLDSISGQDLVKGKIPNMVSAVFNVILHLRSQTIFYLEKQPNYESEVKPDAGSVILMCVEILIKVAGNSSLQMSPCHVSQCLHVPLILFKGFSQLNDYSVSYATSMFSENEHAMSSEDMCHNIVDHQFSVELYASCCRLLCTTLRHRKSDLEPCIAMLEESVSSLLNCLEMVDDDLVGGKGFTWKVEEAIKCASFLRRIYEEIRNQKDMFAEYSFYFLSNYICMYAGRGPLKIGFKREIDEALRPGVYSLIDVCSEADFQLLHTSLGEGPCRSTLKTLLHGYKVNFQYEGKI